METTSFKSCPESTGHKTKADKFCSSYHLFQGPIHRNANTEINLSAECILCIQWHIFVPFASKLFLLGRMRQGPVACSGNTARNSSYVSVPSSHHKQAHLCMPGLTLVIRLVLWPGMPSNHTAGGLQEQGTHFFVIVLPLQRGHQLQDIVQKYDWIDFSISNLFTCQSFAPCSALVWEFVKACMNICN